MKINFEIAKRKIWGFRQADIEVPDKLYEKSSVMVPLFVIQEIPHCNIPIEWKMNKEKAGKKHQWNQIVTKSYESKKYSFVHSFDPFVSAT